MSCVGVASGAPWAGERMLLEDSIRIRASACASADSGRWTAIWSPSKSALMALQRRSGDDHRAPGVVHALTEQVLAEAALLTLEHVAQRLQWPVAGARDGPAAPTVVKQRVNGFLQHAFLVVHDDFRCAQI